MTPPDIAWIQGLDGLKHVFFTNWVNYCALYCHLVLFGELCNASFILRTLPHIVAHHAIFVCTSHCINHLISYHRHRYSTLRYSTDVTTLFTNGWIAHWTPRCWNLPRGKKSSTACSRAPKTSWLNRLCSPKQVLKKEGLQCKEWLVRQFSACITW
jgi:hypothetical protein